MAQILRQVRGAEDGALLGPVPVLCIQRVPQFLLVSEAVEQQQQHPDQRLHLPAVQSLRLAVPLPKTPDRSHPAAHVPERVYLWTWKGKKSFL